MSEDGKFFIFSYGDEVFSRGQVSFNGSVLGYVRRLNGDWYCAVETRKGNLYLVPDSQLKRVPVMQDLVSSKY